MLEPYKNVDGLAAAWRRVVQRAPGGAARGRRAGLAAGRDRPARATTLPDQVEYVPELDPRGVARALDEATVLVLPSWPEGLGRVVIEAFARGRGVVATDAGGIPDLVTDGVEGILIPPADEEALVASLVRVAQRPRAGGAARHRRARCATPTGTRRPADFADGVPRARRPHDRLDAPRLRHADARRGSPGAGADARARRGAGATLRRGGRALRDGRPHTSCRRTSGCSCSARPRARGAGSGSSAALAGAVRERPRPDASSAHMVPLFLLLAAPLREAAAGPAPALVHALVVEPNAAAATRVADVVLSADAALVPAAVDEGARDRARDRHRALRPLRRRARRGRPAAGCWRWDGMPWSRATRRCSRGSGSPSRAVWTPVWTFAVPS